MQSSDTNRIDKNAYVEKKSEREIDRLLEISTTVIVLTATVFLLFVIVATTTDWLPWNVAHMLGY